MGGGLTSERGGLGQRDRKSKGDPVKQRFGESQKLASDRKSVGKSTPLVQSQGGEVFRKFTKGGAVLGELVSVNYGGFRGGVWGGVFGW